MQITSEATSEEPLSCTYIEYGPKTDQLVSKGVHKKLKIARRTRLPSKRFDNQVTVMIRFNQTGRFVNVKIFKNGNVQMTGLKEPDKGLDALRFIADHIRLHNEAFEIVDKERVPFIGPSAYRIRLINTDFRIGVEVRRDKLVSLMRTLYPRMYSSFEPCIYPGVKIQYHYNLANDGLGHCACTPVCNGKDRAGLGQCKRITIAVFQSGCIIITGAQALHQVDAAYAFICDIISSNQDTLTRGRVVARSS